MYSVASSAVPVFFFLLESRGSLSRTFGFEEASTAIYSVNKELSSDWGTNHEEQIYILVQDYENNQNGYMNAGNEIGR